MVGQQIPANSCIDLDAGQIVDCESFEVDFRFHREETEGTSSWTIQPANATGFDALGIAFESPDPPPYEVCQQAEYSEDEVELLPLAEVFWTCFHTPEQHFGWLQPKSWTTGTLVLDWAIYNVP